MGAVGAHANHDRRPRVDRAVLVHPVRRLFGESRGVTVGALVLIALVGLLLFRPLAMTFFSYHRTAGILQERRVEVKELRALHSRLEDQVAFYDSPQFIAEQARSYGMIVPGEKAYVVRELVHPESAAQYAISRLRNVTVDHPAALAAG